MTASIHSRYCGLPRARPKHPRTEPEIGRKELLVDKLTKFLTFKYLRDNCIYERSKVKSVQMTNKIGL